MNARLSIICFIVSILILPSCGKSSVDDYQQKTEYRIVERIYANPDSAFEYIDEAVNADSISADHGVYLKAYYFFYLCERNDSAKALVDFLASRFDNFTPKTKEERNLYSNFLILATKVYKHSENYSYALHYAERASAECRKYQEPSLGVAYDMDCVRGNILFTMNHKEEGMRIIREAIASTDTSKSFLGKQAHLHCHIQQLTLLYELDSCSSMIPFCDESISEVRNADNCTDIPDVYKNESELRNFQDFYMGLFEAYRCSAFAKLGQKDSAQVSLGRCLATNWGKFHRLSSISLIRTYSELGMVDMLDSTYYDFLSKYENDTIQDKLLYILRGKASALMARNDYRNASLLYARISDIENQINQKRIAEQIKFSEEQYNQRVEEKDNREMAELKTRVWITHTISVALVIVIILFLFYNRKQNAQARLAYQALLDKQNILETNAKIITSADTFAKDPSTDLYRQIQKIMEKSKPYLKDDFSINTLAELLNTNVNYVSRAINFATNHSFPQWLAEYRNQIAIRALQDNPKLTINDICLLTGHNTRETFSRQFKALNGISFTDFKEQITKNKKV